MYVTARNDDRDVSELVISSLQKFNRFIRVRPSYPRLRNGVCFQCGKLKASGKIRVNFVFADAF